MKTDASAQCEDPTRVVIGSTCQDLGQAGQQDDARSADDRSQLIKAS